MFLPNDLYEKEFQKAEDVLSKLGLNYQEMMNARFWVMYPCLILSSCSGLLEYLLQDQLDDVNAQDEVMDLVKVCRIRVMMYTKIKEGLPLALERECFYMAIYEYLEVIRRNLPQFYMEIFYDGLIEDIIEEIFCIDKFEYFRT